MRKQLIYDLPTRIFHWSFALLFGVAFFIAKTIDDESLVFSYHMLAGIVLGFLVFLRIIWGVVGTKYVRFSSLILNPLDLIRYFKGIFNGDKTRWHGHNPASSWSTVVMLTSALALAITGYLMATGYKEDFEDLHELVANIFLVTVLFHITGVILHAIRHQDGVVFAMIKGTKNTETDHQPIASSKPITALIFVLLLGGFSAYLIKNFNPISKELHLFGSILQLGEAEEEGR